MNLPLPDGRYLQMIVDLRSQLSTASDENKADLQRQLDVARELHIREMRRVGRIPHTADSLRELETKVRELRHRAQHPLPAVQRDALIAEADSLEDEMRVRGR